MPVAVMAYVVTADIVMAYSYGRHSHGICIYGTCSYGTVVVEAWGACRGYGLDSYGMCSYGIYSSMARQSSELGVPVADGLASFSTAAAP